MSEHGSYQWQEPATAVARVIDKSGLADLIVLAEGSLLDVAGRLRFETGINIERVRISLPDRRTAPRSYEGAALMLLINAARDERVARGMMAVQPQQSQPVLD